jgi:hypothetical protein
MKRDSRARAPGPGREVVRGAEDLVRRHHAHVGALAPTPRRPAVGRSGDDLFGPAFGEVVAQPLGHRRSPSQVDLVARGPQLGGEAPHGGDHEVQPLATGPRRNRASASMSRVVERRAAGSASAPMRVFS